MSISSSSLCSVQRLLSAGALGAVVNVERSELLAASCLMANPKNINIGVTSWGGVVVLVSIYEVDESQYSEFLERAVAFGFDVDASWSTPNQRRFSWSPAGPVVDLPGYVDKSHSLRVEFILTGSALVGLMSSPQDLRGGAQ